MNDWWSDFKDPVLFLEYQFQYEDRAVTGCMIGFMTWYFHDFLTSLIAADLSCNSLVSQLQSYVGLTLGGVYQLHNGDVLLVVFFDLQN